MKTRLWLFATLLVFTAMLACGEQGDNVKSEATQTEMNAEEESSNPERESENEMEEEKGPEYTSRYICPMHCEGSGSDEPGECPVCGMDYVKNEDFQGSEMKENGEMDDTHEDHNHDEHDGHDHG